MWFGDTCVLTKSDKGTRIRGEQGEGLERTSRSLTARHLQARAAWLRGRGGGPGLDSEASGPAGLRVSCAPGTRLVLGGGRLSELAKGRGSPPGRMSLLCRHVALSAHCPGRGGPETLRNIRGANASPVPGPNETAESLTERGSQSAGNRSPRPVPPLGPLGARRLFRRPLPAVPASRSLPFAAVPAPPSSCSRGRPFRWVEPPASPLPRQPEAGSAEGSVPSCSGGDARGRSGPEQNSLESRTLGRGHRQWHLPNCQGLLARARFLSTLLTPRRRDEPGLGS